MSDSTITMEKNSNKNDRNEQRTTMTSTSHKRCIELANSFNTETATKNTGKRTKNTDVSMGSTNDKNDESVARSYNDEFEEDIDDVNKNTYNDEPSPQLNNYDEDSLEGKYHENEGSQEEPSSQQTNDSFDIDKVDEEDDGTFQGVPLSEIPNICQQPPTISDMKDIRDRNHIFLIKPFKYDPTDPDREPEPLYENGTYVDEWDQDNVRLPCSQFYITKNGTQRWSIIQGSLTKLQHLAETHMATMEDIKETIEECAGRKYEFNCLERLLNEVYSADERARFMSTVLSNICSLALNVDKICSRPPPLLRIGSNRTVTMSQKQAASLLACAFFCLFPRRFNQKVGSEYENYQNPNFNTLFQGGRTGGSTWKIEKLKCIFHYFYRITEKIPNGVISFRRYQLPDSCLPKWSESKEPLCKIHITKNKTIEDIVGLLQVDFANKYIGGGVMGDGCVQEEIRFVICPEMLISLLLCEVIQPNEGVFLIGCERFSSYQGYSRTFQFKENYIDQTPKDSWGRKLCHVVAMDAIAFHNRSTQYTIKNMKRELIKAYTCFRVPAAVTDQKSGVATGNWGCGAFNGNKQLKAMIQLIAASQAGRPLVYLTFRDQNLVMSFHKDETLNIIEQWRKRLELKYKLIIHGHEDDEARGVGYGKNRAVQYSSGRFLCFQDADDLMCPNRIHKQYHVAINEKDDAILIGSKYERIPEGSTDRYTQWANNLTEEQLYTQIYLAHGPTLIMPTWFCSRSWFDRLGGFDEIAKGHCEDLTFFFKHLRNGKVFYLKHLDRKQKLFFCLFMGGRLYRVNEILLYYRYHPEATTFSVHEDVIWSVRIQEIQLNIINNLEGLTIWNAGKQGRKFYRSLNDTNKQKVICFCDMDQKKISKGFYTDELSKEKRRIPVIHFIQAIPPIIICVKLGLTNNDFETNLASMNLREGIDYWLFS
ncbi:unnamed protein product [Rotaria sp. Silwood1]|nr:unnamed protein product [Rotaria sp. Silwood1]CAF3383001.1 unnamed protein product [Rotaria sp. Silwood1]CAF4889437.1 unnamed protein product [Rotaria sp. Silwood1]